MMFLKWRARLVMRVLTKKCCKYFFTWIPALCLNSWMKFEQHNPFVEVAQIKQLSLHKPTVHLSCDIHELSKIWTPQSRMAHQNKWS